MLIFINLILVEKFLMNLRSRYFLQHSVLWSFKTSGRTIAREGLIT
jgi:hypothetical protein